MRRGLAAETVQTHLQDERWATSEDNDARNGWRWSTSWKTSKQMVQWCKRLMWLYTPRESVQLAWIQSYNEWLCPQVFTEEKYTGQYTIHSNSYLSTAAAAGRMTSLVDQTFVCVSRTCSCDPTRHAWTPSVYRSLLVYRMNAVSIKVFSSRPINIMNHWLWFCIRICILFNRKQINQNQ